MPEGGGDDRLDSWKEIAAYLRRSVRTVRRWEREEGLPVHRHVHRVLGSVYAQKSEVDAWRLKGRVPTSAADELAIAVIPFRNIGGASDSDYFAEGLTEEVTTTLSRLRSLRVTSSASMRSFRGTTVPAKKIASQISVRFLVEGTVQRADTRLRITAHLVDALNDATIWADRYEGSVEDIFSIQERLARVIASALQLRLSPDEERRLGERAIDSVPAYDCYLRARHEAWRWRKDSIDRAVELLHDGLSIIGENARLYAALGFAHLQYREAGIDISERPLQEAQRCATRVFELEGPSAAALRLRGWIKYAQASIVEAIDDLIAATALEPNNADTLLLLSNCYLICGRVDAARPLIERLLAIDPLTPLTRCMPAWADVLEGHAESALAPYRQMLEMDRSNPMARLFYIWVLMLNGRTEEARSAADDVPDEMRQTVPAQIALFLIDPARPLTAEVEAAARGTSDVFARFLADGYAQARSFDSALQWLQVAVDRGFTNHPFLSEHDPFLRPLHGDPRFQQLLERAGALHQL